jgi:MarR family transcriptional regulator, transcriptional regulator for hemolysin
MPRSDGEPLRTLGHYVARLSRALNRIGDTRLRPLGFATAQLPVLSMLRDGEKRSQSDLARLAKVEQPSMAQLLARMERDGLIRREPDPEDGRSSLASLTAKARDRLAEGRAVLRQANVEAMRGLSDDEQRVLIDLLERVLANVEAITP